MPDFSSFSPNQIQQLMGLSVLPEQNDLLQDQLARAEALRNHAITPHSTGLGAALGGVGDVLRQLGGTIGANRARGAIAENLRKAQALRTLYAQQYGQQMQQPGGAVNWRGGPEAGITEGQPIDQASYFPELLRRRTPEQQLGLEDLLPNYQG